METYLIILQRATHTPVILKLHSPRNNVVSLSSLLLASACWTSTMKYVKATRLKKNPEMPCCYITLDMVVHHVPSIQHQADAFK